MPMSVLEIRKRELAISLEEGHLFYFQVHLPLHLHVAPLLPQMKKKMKKKCTRWLV